MNQERTVSSRLPRFDTVGTGPSPAPLKHFDVGSMVFVNARQGLSHDVQRRKICANRALVSVVDAIDYRADDVSCALAQATAASRDEKIS